MECSQFGSDLVVSIGDVPETVTSSHGKFRGIIQSRIKEVAFAMHLKIRNKRVPVRHGTPSGECMQVHAGKPERRRNKCRGRFAVRTERFSVHKELSVKLARPPAAEHGLDGRHVHAQHVGNWLQIRRKADNRSNIQVAIRPAVERDGQYRAQMRCPRWNGRARTGCP